MHHEFALLGIESWIDWPLDRVQLFLIEKSERDGDRIAEMHRANSRRGKSQFPLFMYTIPVT